MRTSPDPVQLAFDALREAVEHLETRGRVTRIAGVKPEMVRRLPDFDERRLGFRSFSAFVKVAANRGVIRTAVDADGWVRVESVDPIRAPKDEPRRLRPDIWRAFTQWGVGWVRVWDRATARAVRLSAARTASESPEHAALRSSLEAKDGAVIEIQPIDSAVQKAWMEQFAATLVDHPLSAALAGALRDERPFRAFNAALAADDRLRRSYHRERMAHVLTAVRAWAAKHEVDLDSLDHSAPPPEVTPADTQPPRVHDDPAARLRMALHRAVDEMPVEDLRRLAVPAGYITDALL